MRLASRYLSKYRSRYGAGGDEGFVGSALPGGVLPNANLTVDFTQGRGYVKNTSSWVGVDQLSGWSYSRTGTRFSDASDGSLTSFAANVPRITDKGLAIHSGATNLCPYSEAINATNWNDGNSAVTGTEAIDGILITTLEDDSGAAREYMQKLVTVPADSNPVTLSWFMKKTTGALSVWPGVFAQLQGGAGTNVEAAVAVDTTDGTVTKLTGYSAPTVSVEDFGDLWRVIVTLTNNGTETQLRVDLSPAISANEATLSNAATGSGTFGGVQVETGSVATPYIPNATAGTASAGADNADITGSYVSGDVIWLYHDGGQKVETTWGAVESGGVYDLSTAVGTWTGEGYIEQVVIF